MFSRGFLSASSDRVFALPGTAEKKERDHEDFRRLAMQLHYDLPREKGGRSTLLVTPGISNLPAHSGALLAQCLAEELRSPILLVDACRKASDLTRLAEAQGSPGLADYLGDPQITLDAVTMPTKHQNVWLLPSGNPRESANPRGSGRNTDSAGIAALLADAAEKFDFVVLAGGSVLHDSLALSLAPQAGCVLLMAIENQTRLEDLDLAQQSLAFCRPRKIGLLLTLPIRPDGRTA